MKKVLIILCLSCLPCQANDFCKQYKEIHFPNTVEYAIYLKGDKTKTRIYEDVRAKYALECKVLPNYMKHKYSFADATDILFHKYFFKDSIDYLNTIEIIETIDYFSQEPISIPTLDTITDPNYLVSEYASNLNMGVFILQLNRYLKFLKRKNRLNNENTVNSVCAILTALIYHNRNNAPYLEEILFTVASKNNDKSTLYNAYTIGELLYGNRYYFLKYLR